MEVVMFKFKEWCHLPSMHGAINNTHIHISKPKIPFAKKYYYFKIGDYSIVVQTMVNSKKQFMDIFVGLLGSIDDNCVLPIYINKHNQDHYVILKMVMNMGLQFIS
jgi:hypothetical protein